MEDEPCEQSAHQAGRSMNTKEDRTHLEGEEKRGSIPGEGAGGQVTGVCVCIGGGL